MSPASLQHAWRMWISRPRRRGAHCNCPCCPPPHPPTHARAGHLALERLTCAMQVGPRPAHPRYRPRASALQSAPSLAAALVLLACSLRISRQSVSEPAVRSPEMQRGVAHRRIACSETWNCGVGDANSERSQNASPAQQNADVE